MGYSDNVLGRLIDWLIERVVLVIDTCQMASTIPSFLVFFVFLSILLSLLSYSALFWPRRMIFNSLFYQTDEGNSARKATATVFPTFFNSSTKSRPTTRPKTSPRRKLKSNPSPRSFLPPKLQLAAPNRCQSPGNRKTPPWSVRLGTRSV